MKSFLKWALLAAVVCTALVIAHDPLYWRQQVITHLYGCAGLPETFYMPRTIVHGDHRPPPPREAPDVEKLDPNALQAAATYADQHHSVALIVTRHGYLVFEKYWQGSNLDTVVNSQGLGRVVEAFAAGSAIEQRKIGWPDEPIGILLPQLSGTPRGQITVRDLLTLSSGLGGAVGSDAEAYNTDMIRQYLNLPQGARPGTRWRDQNADPDLLAYTIQKATGESYADYISHAVWARIGCNDASLWMDHAGGEPHADSGFFASQGDWLRVAEMLLQNGNYQGEEVVTPRWAVQLLQPSKSNEDYGMYIRRGRHTEPGMSPYVTDDVYLVSGGGNRLWFVPSLQLAILRTGASTDPHWDDGRIPNLIIQGTRDFVPPRARPGADVRQLVPNH